MELLNVDRRTITVDFNIYWSQSGDRGSTVIKVLC